MKIFLKKIASFFRELQYKPERVRRMWFFVFVFATILIVLIPLWLTGLYSTINQDGANDEPVIEKEPVSPSFGDTLKVGAKKVGRDILIGWKKAGEGVSWFLSWVYNTLFKGARAIINIF